MRKWLESNPDETLLTRLTPSSIAHNVLVCESRFKVWVESIVIRNKKHNKGGEEKNIKGRNPQGITHLLAQN